MRRLPYDKFFDQGLRKWITKTAKRHYWRMPPWMDLVDLIQDGHLAFCVCKSRYAHKVKNQAHFMALCKLVFMSIITDHANARTRTVEVCISQIVASGKEAATLEFLAGVEDGEGELWATVQKASDEVRELLAIFQNPRRLRTLRKPLLEYEDGTRQTTNGRLTSMLHISPRINVEARLRAILLEG